METRVKTTNKRKYILFITPSVSMIQNWVERLMPFLDGYTPLILHMASLQDTKPSDIYEESTYDVAKLSAIEIRNLIRRSAPCLCINLNFRSLLEQLILRVCKDEHIPTLYLEHGILNNDNEHFKSFKTVQNKSLTIKRQIVMLWKTFCYSLFSPMPLGNLLKSYKVVRNNDFKIVPFDNYFVYGERCLNYLRSIYPMVDINTNSVLVGYPLFDTAKDAENAIKFVSKEKNGVLFVHQPFILDGITSINYEEERDYVKSLQETFSVKNEKFTILLHPREDIIKYQELYKDTDIDVVLSPNDYKQFANKRLVLGHYSTALLYPLYFDVTTYIVDYPEATIQPIFDGIFPRFHTNGATYDSNVNISNNRIASWIIGPHNTYEHIAEQIKNLIR